jgi:hypothetical protein
MKSLYSIAVTSALLATSSMASGTALVNFGTWGGNGHYYAIYSSDNDLTWSQAEAAAVGLGGHLASIASKAENDFIYSLIAPHVATLYVADPGNLLGPYIGGYRAANGGPFFWSDGETFNYTNWAIGEPSNSGGQENALHFFANGTDPIDAPGEGAFWNDVGPNANGRNLLKPYVVELASAPAVPEPASWAMMIGGFALAGGALRRGRARASITVQAA